MGILWLVIFFVLFLVFVIPLSIEINVNIKCDDYFLNISKLENAKNNVTLKLFSLLPVFNKKIMKSKDEKNKEDKEKENKKRKENSIKNNSNNNQENKNSKDNSMIKQIFSSKKFILKLLKNCYFEKFNLNLGLNFYERLANAYINAGINTLLCMYINYNSRKFNYNKLYYSTYTSENLLKLNFHCIIKLSLANTIRVIISEYLSLRKNEIDNGTNGIFTSLKKGRKVYGETSN